MVFVFLNLLVLSLSIKWCTLGKRPKKFYFPQEQFWHPDSEANTARLCNSCIINEPISPSSYAQKGGCTEEESKKQNMRNTGQFRNP